MSHAVQKMSQTPSLMPPAESLRLSRRFRKILKNLMKCQMKTSQDPLGPDKSGQWQTASAERHTAI
ncbi:hypothetical protein DSO57_1006467 [Entomophthora muscae]|uniref:Uncharacterized protein n=1 Tax=Entomophthora muscae TaxID=34485 RepID=A0ACC2UTJ6_9FUNG|nr:hypothetical protein DSO57_1006467 [Entomophthora muscae]